MTVTWSPDYSNWDSPFVEDNIACISTCTGPPVIRASLERPALSEITRNQLNGFKQAGKKTTVYGWCYGEDVPELMIEKTVTLVDDLIGIRRIWLDIEDYNNFVKLKAKFIPTRIIATFNALGISPMFPPQFALLPRAQTAKAFSFASLTPASAVAWLRKAVTEARRLGYIPGYYSASGVWHDLCGGDTSFGDVDGWSADWDGNPDPTKIGTAWGGITRWIGKQYIGSGMNVTFCNHASDLSVWVDELLDPTPVPGPGPTPDPGPGTIDIPDTLDRLNGEDLLIDQFALAAHANVEGMRQNLRT